MMKTIGDLSEEEQADLYDGFDCRPPKDGAYAPYANREQSPEIVEAARVALERKRQRQAGV